MEIYILCEMLLILTHFKLIHVPIISTMNWANNGCMLTGAVYLEQQQVGDKNVVELRA